MNGSEIRSRVLQGLLAAGGLAFAHAALAQAPVAPSPAAGGVARTDWMELFRDVRFTLGPVLWRGEMTTEFRAFRHHDQPAQRAFSEIANFSVASYIYQPWFAQVSGNLGAAWSSAGGATRGRSTALTGGGSISVFPSSRFPFEVSLAVGDSRASETVVDADFRSVLAGVRQSYRAADDTTQVTARLDRSEITGSRIGRDVLDVATATVSRRIGSHGMSADGFLSANSGSASGSATRIRRLNGVHSYVPAENLSVETMATYNWQEVEQGLGPFSGAIAGRVAQLASLATWRPDEGEPLHDEKHPMLVTAGLRLAAIGFEQGRSSADAISVNGSAGVSYEIDPLTRVNASGSLTRAISPAASRAMLAALNANVTYDPPPLRFAGNAYGWRLSGGAMATTGGELDQQTVFAQGNHQISRDMSFTQDSLLTVTIGQGLRGSLGTGDAGGLALSHNAQATWTLLGEAATQTYVALSAADARNYATPGSMFQMVNLQLTRQAPINALSYWSANLTVQGSRQRDDAVQAGAPASHDTGLNVSTYGSLSYQHRRLFGVPRLTMSATFTANQSQLESRAQGDLTAPVQALGNSFDARLEYRIGKLDARLVLRSAEVDGRRNTGLYVRVTRNF